MTGGWAGSKVAAARFISHFIDARESDCRGFRRKAAGGMVKVLARVGRITARRVRTAKALWFIFQQWSETSIN
jgi:hypothetical protein